MSVEIRGRGRRFNSNPRGVGTEATFECVSSVCVQFGAGSEGDGVGPYST